MTRLAADLLCVLLVIAGHCIALPLFAWRGVQALRGGDMARVERAALLWDLCIGALLGAEPGETVSTWAARVRAATVLSAGLKAGVWAFALRRLHPSCVLCRLLSVRWPSHCEDADNVLFNIVRSRRSAKE